MWLWMKRFVIAVAKRLLASIVVLVLVSAFGFLYGRFAGPSRVAYASAVMLIAWPWALPQIFVVVSIVWFVVQRVRRSCNLAYFDASSSAN